MFGISSGYECVPVPTKLFTPTSTVTNGNTTLSITLQNSNPTLAMTGAAFTDSYPAGIVNAPTPNVTNTCGGTVTATAGGNSIALTGGTIPANGSCQITASVRATSAGTRTNTIAVNDVSATVTGSAAGSLRNPAETSTTLVTVANGFTIAKSVTTRSDDFSLTTNPKAIPNAYMEYTLVVTNNLATSIDPGTIRLEDVVPANTIMVVNNTYTVNALGPVQFDPDTSGLTATFSGLSSQTDSLDFSNVAAGTTWTYVPVASAGGTDSNVRRFRVRPNGSMLPNSSFTVRFLVRIN